MYGVGLGPSWVSSTAWAVSMKSQTIGRLSRGSMISSMLKASAVRNGDGQGFEAVLDLLLLGGGVVGLPDDAAVGGGHAAGRCAWTPSGRTATPRAGTLPLGRSWHWPATP